MLRRPLRKGTCLVLLMSVMLGCTGPNPLRSARDRFLTNEPAPVKSALDPSVGAGRPLELSALPAPPMVLDPKLKEDRELQLAEAVEIALRNSDMLRVLSGGDVATRSSSAYDPAIGEAAVVAALAEKRGGTAEAPAA